VDDGLLNHDLFHAAQIHVYIAYLLEITGTEEAYEALKRLQAKNITILMHASRQFRRKFGVDVAKQVDRLVHDFETQHPEYKARLKKSHYVAQYVGAVFKGLNRY
jgi:hypothetical protein